jgi:hypothetical protein
MPPGFWLETPRQRERGTVLVSQDLGRADTWSLLLTWLVVLSGVKPFYWLPTGLEREQQLGVHLALCYEDHEVMQYSLEDRYSTLLSPAALAFFKEVLVANPQARPTPAQLLQHQYVRE